MWQHFIYVSSHWMFQAFFVVSISSLTNTFFNLVEKRTLFTTVIGQYLFSMHTFTITLNRTLLCGQQKHYNITPLNRPSRDTGSMVGWSGWSDGRDFGAGSPPNPPQKKCACTNNVYFILKMFYNPSCDVRPCLLYWPISTKIITSLYY